MSIIKYLKNSPCGEDLFEGKSQDTIAKNIAEILANNPTTKIIGIDGGWGSGKSNVVYQVETILKDKYHFFIYDAWGHQEDLQRRAVLEELTDNLIKSKLLPNSWINKLKSLLAKKRETTTQTIPNLSIGIILSAFAIIISPLFKTLSDVLGSRHICWRILITSIPFLVIFITYLYYVCTERGLLKGLKKMYFIYKDKQKEDTTFETISEAEPSVVKFREWMTHLSKDLIGKKLVIVFDNMDRLPQKKVQELWSSIHVFFAETPYDNIRVIIPFDREHIKSAFKNEDVKNKDVKNKDVKNEECFGNDFIDKTFDVVFRVSPPIMTDWKNYFTLKWEEAFGSKENSTDFDRVTQIYDLIAKDITPRKIIAFINEFVSIKTSLNSYNIPDRYIALFILGKENITAKPLEEIITPSYLSGVDFLYRSDEDLPKYIASLFYQVDPERANQVVFTDKLKRALDNFNKDDLDSISKIPNFYSLLENAIASITNIENASLALNSISDDCIGNHAQLKHIWDCLYKQIKPLNNNLVSEGQLALLKNIEDKNEYARKLIQEIQDSPNFATLNYVKSIDSIRELTENCDNKLDKKIVDIESFIEFVNDKKMRWTEYNIHCNQESLDNYIDTYKNSISKMTFMHYIKENYDITEFIAQIETYIPMYADDLDIKSLKILYDRYKEVAEIPLKQILTEEAIYSLFSEKPTTEISGFYYDLIAMRISYLNNFSRSYDDIFEDILESSDSEIVTNVSHVIEYYMSVEDILIGIKSFSEYSLYKLVVNNLISNAQIKKPINLPSIISEYDTICNLAELEGPKLLSSIDKWNSLSYEALDLEFIRSKTSIKLLEDCCVLKNKLSNHILDTFKISLEEYSVKMWKEFVREDKSIQIQSLLLFKEYKYPQNAKVAIIENLELIANLEIEVPNKEIWNNIISSIHEQGNKLASIFNNIRDVFCNKANINTKLFNFFGGWLFEYAKLDTKKEVLRTIFKSDIIREESTLELMMSNKDIMKKIVENAEEEADEFKEYFISLASQNGNEKIKGFATYIGIEFPIKEKDDKNESE